MLYKEKKKRLSDKSNEIMIRKPYTIVFLKLTDKTIDKEEKGKMERSYRLKWVVAVD